MERRTDAKHRGGNNSFGRQKADGKTFESGLLLRLSVHRYKNHTTISVSYRRVDFSRISRFIERLKHVMYMRGVAPSRAFGVFLISLGLIGVTAILYPSAPAQFIVSTPVNAVAPSRVDLQQASSTAYSVPRSVPTRLEIPSIGLKTDLITTSVNERGELLVPERSDVAAWYDHSPTPGEIGPSVIVGHLNTAAGDAVFAHLHATVIGDDVFIQRADGNTVHFRVERIAEYLQDQFPSQEVYGNIHYAGLRLITCGGTFNYLAGRYTTNTVVFARLMER